MKKKEFEDERVLDDEQPVYWGFWYIIRDEPIRCPLHRGTIKDLKLYFATDEVRRCDAVGRGLLLV